MWSFLLHDTTATTEQTSGNGMTNMLRMGSCLSTYPVTVKLSLRGVWLNTAPVADEFGLLLLAMMGIALTYLRDTIELS